MPDALAGAVDRTLAEKVVTSFDRPAPLEAAEHILGAAHVRAHQHHCELLTAVAGDAVDVAADRTHRVGDTA